VFTTAYIERATKRVVGAPLRYAAGRKQLAFYHSADTEAARTQIELETLQGFALEQRPRFQLEPSAMLGTLERGAALDQLVKGFDVAAKSFEPISLARMEAAFGELFRVSMPANNVLAPSAMHALVAGTVESIVVSRLRMMRWQGLALLGYRFFEGEQEVEVVAVKDVAEQRRRMDELGRKLASSTLFSGELIWLKNYAIHELGLMRMELDGAELEAVQD
jgi:hypothetical protein